MATKKKDTVAARVAAESPYARAAAKWVAAKTGKDANVIYGVDFEIDPGYQSCGCDGDYGSFDTGPELYVSYSENGHWRQLGWAYISPGTFIEECVAFLDK
jgi:hypothetical protein